MKANKIKNLKLRLFFSNKELFFKLNKFVTINFLNFYSLKKDSNLFLKLKKQRRSKAILKNKCILTGCNNSVNKMYNVSRVEFRRLLRFGIIPNYNKSVW